MINIDGLLTPGSRLITSIVFCPAMIHPGNDFAVYVAELFIKCTDSEV
jgi:hypothetical protein